MIEYKTNYVNTELTEELLNSLNKEERETILDYMSSIVFLQNLTSPNRKHAKDLERWDNPDNDSVLPDGTLERKIDPKGRIRVDLANPHILEDIDYFREAAIHFEEHGVYTFLRPNRNPYSDYRKFWDLQIERCWNGMTREYDGEWITGYHYFYLNFSPIQKSKQKKGSRRFDRIEGLPDFYDGDYWFFHYIERARENGKHCGGLKKRGAGYSLKGASMLGRNFEVGESNEVSKKVRSIAIANEKEYLIKDGILNKFVDVTDFLAKHTPFPFRKELKDSWGSMHWQLGWKDSETGQLHGNQNEVLGVTLKNDPEKARGKRAQFILWEEFGKFDQSIKAWNIGRPSVEDGEAVFGQMCFWGCLTAGNKVWDNEGNLVNIEDLDKNKGILGYKQGEGISKENITYWQPPAEKECVRIITNTGRSIECSIDHPILWSKKDFGTSVKLDNKRKFIKGVQFKEAENIKIGDQIATIEEVNIFSDKEMWNPRLIGLLIGDGTYGFNKTPVLSNCDKEINDYIYSNFDCVEEKGYITKDNKLYKETRIRGIAGELRKLGIYGQTKSNKRLPDNIHSYSKHSICELIAGLFDADGYYNPKGNISIESCSKIMLLELQLLLQKLGIHGSISEIKARISETRKDKNNYFRLDISDKRSIEKFKENITPMIIYKKNNLEKCFDITQKRIDTFSKSSNLKGMRFERVVSIEYTGIKPIYNLTAGTTNTYIGNGIITHNTGGTATSAFEGLREIFYNPSGYNVYPLDNVWDKNTKQGNKCAFFHPGYLNQTGYMDKNGNSDVVASLISVIKERINIKYNSNESSTLPQRIAEMALTPQEAIMKVSGIFFPTVDIRDYLEECRVHEAKFVSTHLVGDLVIKQDGIIDFNINFDKIPIRRYNTTKHNLEGAIELFAKPQIDPSTKKPYENRYIAGIDPVDNDYISSGSLASIFIFDLWTDEIVAEYTGRPQLADDFYEICRRMLLYYNAVANYENNIKGLFGYFNNKSCLYLLCDTPNHLRDIEEQKQNLFGNRAKGTRANIEVNNEAKRLQKTWMLTPYEYVDDQGEEVKTINLRRIRSLGYLEELYEYNDDGNFDRISAMGMVMILRQDRLKLTKSLLSGEYEEEYIEEDPFIKANYDSLVESWSTKDLKKYNI